ncbi:hypothetical protein Tco_0361955, partial [Tanacetum coccineum]
FKVTPKISHLLAINRIFRYLKGKPTLGLWYSTDSLFELVAYTDSDYAGATQDMKSTTRDFDKCMDISEIIRKPSKTSKHGHENGRVNKSRKPKIEKVKSTVNSSQSWSTKVNKAQNVSE